MRASAPPPILTGGTLLSASAGSIGRTNDRFDVPTKHRPSTATAMSAILPRPVSVGRLGPYELIGKPPGGGNAELFVGEREGSSEVAIKRLRAGPGSGLDLSSRAGQSRVPNLRGGRLHQDQGSSSATMRPTVSSDTESGSTSISSVKPRPRDSAASAIVSGDSAVGGLPSNAAMSSRSSSSRAAR
jgi:hypothetical protein